MSDTERICNCGVGVDFAQFYIKQNSVGKVDFGFTNFINVGNPAIIMDNNKIGAAFPQGYFPLLGLINDIALDNKTATVVVKGIVRLPYDAKLFL